MEINEGKKDLKSKHISSLFSTGIDGTNEKDGYLLQYFISISYSYIHVNQNLTKGAVCTDSHTNKTSTVEDIRAGIRGRPSLTCSTGTFSNHF